MPWDVPDFDKSEEIDYEELWKRIRTLDPSAMTEWPYSGPMGFNQRLVNKCCVDTSEPFVAEWQKTRLFMKGKPTHVKLSILDAWYDKYKLDSNTEVRAAVIVQVYNYLGALRRGGQLNDKNQVRKYI